MSVIERKLQELSQRLDDARQELDDAKSDYLRAHAWEHRCDFPGAMWLWQKTLDDGRIVAVSASDAIYIQESINGPDDEDEDDEEE